MTDNEGESAYSYRNVVRTLGALGLDFLFATDHASDSKQVDGGLSVARCGSTQGAQCNFNSTQPVLNTCQEGGQTKQCILFQGTEARDLNQNRFTMAKQIIYGSDGANEAIARDLETGGFARYRSASIVPQIFMGEEVDAWPEMSRSEYETGDLSYGDRQRYKWSDVSDCLQKSPYRFCTLYDPATLSDKFHQPPPTCTNKTIGQLCREHFSSVLPGPRYFSKDNQGIPHWDISPDPSRQHLVYFPVSGLPDGNGFVASRTTTYGGASRPLDDVVREIESKGVTFLAHPLVSAKPGGQEGPDMVPYSQLSLGMAWSSRAVLGLQFWNENDRLASEVDKGCTLPPPTLVRGVSLPLTVTDPQRAKEILRPCERVYESSLSDGGTSYTSVAPFLGMWAGGDASRPWSWRESVNPQKKYSQLYHGAFIWDRYLRKGLNPGETAQLSAWLPPGEPRKWFMAGGSDAHGDINYRRDGYLCASEWCEARVVDTAIGNPRNLVFVGPPTGPSIPGQLPGTMRRHTNTQIITSLQAALRIAIDKNRDGRLTDGLDFPMGSTFNLFPKEQVPILVEWISSPEFGRVKKIDVYVGTKERTYVPTGHGPSHTVCRGASDNDARDPKGDTLCDEAAGAYLPGWTVLQVDLTGLDPGHGYHGMAQIYLNPYEFGITLEDKRLFYVRAYAQTFGRTAQDSGCTDGRQGPPLAPLAPGKCGDRLAYSNPVWGRYHAVCDSARFAPAGRQSIDLNNDGVPDTCQAPLPDPCPALPVSSPGGGKGFAGAGAMAPLAGTLAIDPQGGGQGDTSGLRSCQMVKSLVFSLAGGDVVAPDLFNGTVESPSSSTTPSPGGVAPGTPQKFQVAPFQIMPRGIEGEPPAESTPGTSSEPAPGVPDQPAPDQPAPPQPKGIKSDVPQSPP
jgi:hypothetical protein